MIRRRRPVTGRDTTPPTAARNQGHGRAGRHRGREAGVHARRRSRRRRRGAAAAVAGPSAPPRPEPAGSAPCALTKRAGRRAQRGSQHRQAGRAAPVIMRGPRPETPGDQGGHGATRRSAAVPRHPSRGQELTDTAGQNPSAKTAASDNGSLGIARFHRNGPPASRSTGHHPHHPRLVLQARRPTLWQRRIVMRGVRRVAGPGPEAGRPVARKPHPTSRS